MSIFDGDNYWGHEVRVLSQRSSTPLGFEGLRSEVKGLKQQVGRLALINQALWELLQKKVDISEAELLRAIEEVDLRDGRADGQISEHPLRCPKCERVCSSRHDRCIYCGQEFDTDVFAGFGQ